MVAADAFAACAALMCGTCSTTSAGSTWRRPRRALHEPVARLSGPVARRLQALAGVPQRILPRGPIELIAPFPKVCAVREEHLPRRLEFGAGLVEGRRDAALASARVGSGEAATPFKWIGVVRVSGPDRERAGMDVAVVDLPALLADFRISSAGELRHQTFNCARKHQANRLPVGGLWLRNAPAIVCVIRDIRVAMKLCAAILVAALAVPAAASADYLGKVTAVVDGDTFTMEAENGKVRGLERTTAAWCRLRPFFGVRHDRRLEGACLVCSGRDPTIAVFCRPLDLDQRPEGQGGRDNRRHLRVPDLRAERRGWASFIPRQCRSSSPPSRSTMCGCGRRGEEAKALQRPFRTARCGS